MASSSSSSNESNPYVMVEVGEEYPYPTHVCAPNFVTLKLSCRDEYSMWKTQMLCLLGSYGMCGFIDGTFLRPQTSVCGKEKVSDHHTPWGKSDALVKSWILGSLSKETLGYVLNRLTEKFILQRNAADFSAKDVWDELQTIYGPAALLQLQTKYGPAHVLPQEQVEDEQDKKRAELHQIVYQATVAGNWNLVHVILKTGQITVVDKITNNENTVLHVAVGTTKKSELLEKLLKLIPENTPIDVRNSDGSTLLHVAAIVGNTEAVNVLMEKNRDLLLAMDNEGHTPLAVALSNMHTETSNQLLLHINADKEKFSSTIGDALFSGTSGDHLLVTAISSKDFRLARKMMRKYKALHGDAVMVALAQNFPCELSILEEYIGTYIILFRVTRFLETSFNYMVFRCVPLCGSWVGKIIRLFYAGTVWIVLHFPPIFKILERPFIKKRVQIHQDAYRLLIDACSKIKSCKDSRCYHHYYTNPIFEATRLDACVVVSSIISEFPNAVWSANENGHNFIQYAVINRSEKVYNLLYQMSEHKNIYRTIKDSFGNNLLHLAGRLAPANKLNLISGAALQIQRELQWFKEVERFVCPLNVVQKNSFHETPQMVFTREHKELVIDGEKWMKATAESYTITAALITTIMFAAAITVPGGNNQEKGIPIFSHAKAFTIFAISDAISLFASVTSLLMFLSILTARFAEQDFLFKLPSKLIIGLAMLFISTTSMVVAFGATLYLVFGHDNSRILTPIAVFTCLPITAFVTLQFRLVIDLISTTYGLSIFGKKRNSVLY
ncbi:uncharacterized protein LOC111903718 [Lactuca sativa]|uniref:uncharacterized protein LOC111903718 n=1 Tax=Lactuca sativa TaxID=4236 RepID=UPI000CD7F3EA|nr:uncharacterized protein LOC111903718 [Lactuca sativa]